MAGIQDFVCFEDDFFGGGLLAASGQGSPWVVTNTGSSTSTFADVDGTPLEKWIDDFKRDRDPEGSIRIWEDMQVAYKRYLDGRDLSLEARKEVYKVVLFRSMASEQDVLSRIEFR